MTWRIVQHWYDVKKLHAAAARSTFVSQNAKKPDTPGPLFEVMMLKNGTPLQPEAHLQVKMYKTPAFWNTFGGSDVEKVSDRIDR